ncbi:MAG: tRNA lysidine(34) synthetase TilS [Desulfobacterales bacterium]|nr:MAG: tRNA lysidine(34) synthetase TilS [Desulfobacterales bacterium]
MSGSYTVHNNKLIQIVGKTITAFDMLKSGDAVIIGVSGGPDSVALLHILIALAPRFSLTLGVAHLNHCLRNVESDNDAEFVTSLSRTLDLPCYVHKEDVRKYQVENKLSMEEAARQVRYTFLRNLAKRNGFNKIALGHHRDDNAELVLMNLFRGSGPLGLSGIPPVRDNEIIRPLIHSQRSEIIDFLKTNRFEYISDTSNKDAKYLRNRIRHHLIPHLKTSYNPNIIDTLNRLTAIIRSEEDWIKDEINQLFKKIIVNRKDSRVALSVSKLKRTRIAQQRRIIRKGIHLSKGNLRRITFAHIDAVRGLLSGKSGTENLDLPDRIRVHRAKDLLIINKENGVLLEINEKKRLCEKISFNYTIEKPKSIFIKEINTHMAFSEMHYERMPDFLHNGRHTAFVDKHRLCFPLTLRNIKSGDRFRPLGMTGTQKVKKYFIDKKVPLEERYRCPVLLSQDKIVWLAGHRIDESVKLTPLTRKVLKIELFLA